MDKGQDVEKIDEKKDVTANDHYRGAIKTFIDGLEDMDDLMSIYYFTKGFLKFRKV